MCKIKNKIRKIQILEIGRPVTVAATYEKKQKLYGWKISTKSLYLTWLRREANLQI